RADKSKRACRCSSAGRATRSRYPRVVVARYACARWRSTAAPNGSASGWAVSPTRWWTSWRSTGSRRTGSPGSRPRRSRPRPGRCGSRPSTMSQFVRPELAELPAYVPGKPAPIGPGGVSYKLSSNENPYPPLPGVLEAAELACARMNRYPDMANTAITEAVASRLGVDHDQLAFGCGSSAALYHLIQATCTVGDE